MFGQVFLTLLEIIIEDLTESADTSEFSKINYIYIDDPISSLDDTNIINAAIYLSDVIGSAENTDLKFVISTHQALFYNTTGDDNIAIGYTALLTNNTGTRNIAIGYQALKNNTGSGNFAIGYQAGYNNAAGTYNTLIGYQSGFSLSSGSFNYGIGYQSLYALTTGTYNLTLTGSFIPIEGETYPRVGCGVRVGSPYGRTYSMQDWWQTSPVTEILEESINDQGYWTVKFKTRSSVYTWKEF